MSRTHPWCHITLRPRGQVRSSDKLKALFLFFQKFYHHELCRVVTYDEVKSLQCQVTLWPLCHVRSRDKIKTKSFLLNNVGDHQLDRMMTYNKENLPIMPHDPPTTWSHEVTWQNKNKISALLQNPLTSNITGWWKLTRNVRWLSDNVITWGHVTNSKLNIFSSARPLTFLLWPVTN